MRLPAYLCTSRHGIFYFRFPLPPALHPTSRRTHLKVSLATRDPREARHCARWLAVAGQALIAQPNVRAMRYDEMREHVRDHFGKLLEEFEDQTAANGPAHRSRLEVLRATERLAEGHIDDWGALTHPEGVDGLLRAFCELRGVSFELTDRERELLTSELKKGHREYLARALEHTEKFETLSLEAPRPRARLEMGFAASPVQGQPEVLPLAEVVARYFAEFERTQSLAAKTEGEKRDALALMAALTDSKSPACMTKADAQEIKVALFKLPKNRSKNPKTRDLPLKEMLEVPGVQRIAARTLNVYLGHMQHFFGWAVDNGYSSNNPFQGLRLKNTARGADDGRRAFSAEQLALMHLRLADEDRLLVKKDVHRWPALIGMFTGMRLNEIAQLEVKDIEVLEDVPCIRVTPDGEGNKRLKNASSRRLVPIHTRLREVGFLTFHERMKAQGNTRLFPSLPYCPKNGYGRNAGRWFTERFLPEIGLSDQGLVFHCLRHTMVTRLAQAGVEEAMIKSLVGHSQTGVTFSTYFKGGYLPTQLAAAINKYDF